MIISASRRTDIPAYYGEWFSHRLEAGYCLVTNPFNPEQVSRVSLRKGDVDAFVFWTRNPQPFFRVLDRIEGMDIPYYFLFTVTAYQRFLEPRTPALPEQAGWFRELSKRVGGERVIWRYDPVLVSNFTNTAFHRAAFSNLASALEGHTRRVIVSAMDLYRKARRRLNLLEQKGFRYGEPQLKSVEMTDVLSFISSRAVEHGMEVFSCAEPSDLEPLGIKEGRCIDAELLNRLFGTGLRHVKDRGQRAYCGCSTSRDIGANNTCPAGCVYCYATESPEEARQAFLNHEPLEEQLRSR